MKFGEFGVFLRLRMCFTFNVQPNKQKRETTKQVFIFFQYSGINDRKRTCCSLEFAFPELQNLYRIKWRNLEGQAYEHLIAVFDPVSGQPVGGSVPHWQSTFNSLQALCCMGFHQQPNVGLWWLWRSPSQYYWSYALAVNMSMKCGAAEQLVSRNEAAATPLIYSITTWRLLVVSGRWLGSECWDVLNRDSCRFSSCERQPF